MDCHGFASHVITSESLASRQGLTKKYQAFSHFVYLQHSDEALQSARWKYYTYSESELIFSDDCA